VQHFAEDDHANASLEIHADVSHFHLRFEDGVSILQPPHIPRIGDASVAMKLTSVTLHDKILHINADICPTADNSFRIRTSWSVLAAKGATVRRLPENLYEVQIQNPVQSGPSYAPVAIEISFGGQ
jgi:hypothetical protein